MDRSVRGSSVRARIGASAVGMVLLALAAVPAQAGTAQSDRGGLRITLSPGGSMSAPQGEGFRLSAYAMNMSNQEIMATVKLRVKPSQASGKGIAFEHWMIMLPPGGFEQSEWNVVSAMWFKEMGSFRVDAWVGNRVLATLQFTVDPPRVTTPRFDDVTASAGIDTNLPMAMCSRFVSGAAWGDVDGDDALDLYVPDQEGPAQLWINDGTGHFTDQATARAVDNAGSVGLGAVFADYNNDGAEDLYVNNDGPNRLYMNDGTGHFVDATAAAGVGGDSLSSSASWGDFDADGYVDLYVTNYVACVTKPDDNSARDVLYRNNGDGTFTDVTSYLGPPDITEGAGFQAAWFDYNGDGRVDLYLANDHIGLSSPGNKLWRNDGPGQGGSWKFTDASQSSKSNWVITDMGIGVGDVNNDSMLDMALSNMGPNYLPMNQGDGTFANMAGPAHVDRPMQKAMAMSVTWGLAFADLNLDGWQDLYVNAGAMPMMMMRQPGDMMKMDYQPNELFANLGGGMFADLSAPSGTNNLGMSRGLAFADFDRDGRMDMFVVNQHGPSVLYRNTTRYGGQHWLEVRTEGTMSNRDGCGATLIATVGSKKFMREVFCGSVGLGSGSDSTVHFGLGGASKVDSLKVMWPSGAHQVLRNLRADRLLTVVET